jgi:hypothetical protein
VSSYYLDEFNRISESDEAYTGKWNWAAFLFGPLWALSKGLWESALVAWFVLGLAIVVYYPLGPILNVAYCIALGIRGNYVYYNRLVNRKQIVI